MKIYTIILIIFLNFAAYAYDRNSELGTSGDVLRVLLPAAAYSATFYNNDKAGRNEFYKSFAANTGATYAIKQGAPKERPDESGNDSLPSGHASMSFQAAAFMHKRYGLKYGLPAYAAATYTSLTRLATDSHHEEDVIIGAAIGVASAMIFTTEFNGVSITPALNENSIGITASLRW